VGVVEEVAKMIFYGISGIDINGSPIARDKWKPSSDKWNLIHTCPIGQVIISVRYVHSYWRYTWH
jgi:hypothetical protein